MASSILVKYADDITRAATSLVEIIRTKSGGVQTVPEMFGDQIINMSVIQ